MLPLNDVQEAVFKALTTALAPVPVVDAGAVENLPFPYVTIGSTEATPADTLHERGADFAPVVHCWSRYKGTREVHTLIEKTAAALDGKTLPVDGFQWVGTRLESAQVLLELDGVTRHGIVRFRIFTFQKTEGVKANG